MSELDVEKQFVWMKGKSQRFGNQIFPFFFLKMAKEKTDAFCRALYFA
jgi:hypothetical protein